MELDRLDFSAPPFFTTSAFYLRNTLQEAGVNLGEETIRWCLIFQGKAEGYGCLVAARKLVTPQLWGFCLHIASGPPEEGQSEETAIRTDGSEQHTASRSVGRQEGYFGEAMLTSDLQRGASSVFTWPPPKGASPLLTPKRSCVVYTQLSGTGFRDVENKEKLAARVTLIIFLPTGCVHKSDGERIPSSFSICPTLGSSKLCLKNRYLK